MTYRLCRRDLLNLISASGAALAASTTSAAQNTIAKKPKSGKQPSPPIHGLCLNEDHGHFFSDPARHDIDRKQIDAWVDQYAHTQVRELMLNPNVMRTSYASKVWTPYWKGFDPQAGPDQPMFASLSASDRPRAWHAVYNTWKLDHDGIDPYECWISRARKWGISPWISMRMNDIHEVHDVNHFMHSDFWRQNPQFRRVSYRFGEWPDRAFDYGHPEVREYHMALVRELAERYDFDGLELDWMRFGFHFRPGHDAEGIELLTAFTVEVRRLLDGWQKKRGHRIRLGARVPSRPQTALGLGMDAVTWAQRGLVDMLVITPFWASIEPDMPIELWKQLLRGTHVTLAAGLELLVRPNSNFKPILNSLETVRGAAATLLDRGADRIYLFNYMDNNTAMPDLQNYQTLLREVGSPETLAGKERRHIVTFSDTWAPGEPRAQILPAKCSPKRWKAFRVPTGPKPATGRAVARLGIQGAAEAEVKTWEVRVNGELCTFAGTIKPQFSAPDNPLFEFLVSPGVMNRGYNLIELTPSVEAEIVWVEMALDSPAKPA